MKKVLVITYYFPPAGGPGVQRILKFVKYLKSYNWQQIILTVDEPDSPIVDESLFQDIPKDVKVYRTAKVEPYNLYKKSTGKKSDERIPTDVLITKRKASTVDKISNWIRANLFIPDAKIGWIPYAVKKGKEIVEKEGIELIFSSSPPQTVNLVAKKLAKKTKLKWVADFRDPWMEIVYYQKLKRSIPTRFIDSKLERGVLKKADKIISINSEIINIFKSKVGKRDFHIIPNGFDEDDFNYPQKAADGIFTIVHTGNVSIDRVVPSFFEILRKFKEDFGVSNFKLIFAGKLCDEFVTGIKENNLTDNFEAAGYLPHDKSVELLVNSDVQLLIVDDVPKKDILVTGKIFEYLGTKKPVFAIGPLNGSANRILTETDSGRMVEYDDAQGGFDLLRRLYTDWKAGKSTYTFNVAKYSRRVLTGNLAEILNAALEK